MKLPREYSDLQEWAIAHFRVKGGFIAPKMAVDEDFSDIKLWLVTMPRNTHFRWAYGNSVYRAGFACELCWNCRIEFMKLFLTIQLYSPQYGYNCQLCGKECPDDIPF